MKTISTFLLGSALTTLTMLAPCAAQSNREVPQSVTELWADFDPRRDPLETEVIREFEENGIVVRHVRFLVGHFKGKPARMTAIYAFPKSAADKLPAVMHIHGGGQRAFLHEVKLLALRGYAALSVNWGGSGNGKPPMNSVEGAMPGDPNTDWGAVDPSQLNVAGYNSVLPGPLQVFEDREHPQNNNWYVLTLGCRRALTFLEQQPEVDPERIGVHGFSMGGNLTMYVAGSDRRVKAAVPAVGGAGYRTEPHSFIGGTAQQDHIRGDTDLFRRTLGFESYAPLITCPILHRSATNDFHGWMDDVYRTNALMPNRTLRYSWTPHLNHRLSPETAVTMPLWFDQHLKGGPSLPNTPTSALSLDTADHVPRFSIRPDESTLPAAHCEVYYSVDPDPRARFWRSALTNRDGSSFTAALPLDSADRPLFAFANVYHTLKQPESMAAIPGYSRPIKEVCISSQLHIMKPADLTSAGTVASLKRTPIIDEFTEPNPMRDWYTLNADHPTLVEHWTRKLTDPLYQGPQDAKLRLTLRLVQANTINVVIIENEWRTYRGPRKTYLCRKQVSGSTEPQTITLGREDFESKDGHLQSWNQVDQLGICAHVAEPKVNAPSAPNWVGPPATLVRLEWDR